MSPSVNRFSELPQSSGDPKPEPPPLPSPQTPADTASNSDLEQTTEENPAVTRQQPIPPPSEPMQYRAIGLVKGKYTSSDEQFTRGMLLATDGTAIDAVLLGRVMSLVKNHLNLEQEHLWVVYPRMRQEDGNLHVQIVGVWEPERLNQPSSDPEAETAESSEPTDIQSESAANDGYFSIRGEVIFQSREEEEGIIVKIKQSPRKQEDTPKFFKLKLIGVVQEKAVGHFMDLQVQRQGNSLVIQESQDIGRLPPRKVPGKKPFRGGGGRPPSRQPGGGSRERPVRPGKERPAAIAPPSPKRREPLPKPVKRSSPPPE